MPFWRPALALCLTALLFFAAFPAQAQAPLLGVPSASQPAAPEIPAELTPEQVDGLLARLTDAEIRALLAQELHRRAEEESAADTERMDSLAAIRDRFDRLFTELGTRAERWQNQIANLHTITVADL